MSPRYAVKVERLIAAHARRAERTQQLIAAHAQGPEHTLDAVDTLAEASGLTRIEVLDALDERAAS
jgi:hypothetical protein